MVCLTGVNGDVEELGVQVALIAGPPGQEEAAPVGVGEQTDVHENLVAEHVDVELVGHVADKLHKQVGLGQLVEPATSLLASVASIGRKIKEKTLYESFDELRYSFGLHHPW